MKKSTKYSLIALLLVLVVVSTIVLVACNDNKVSEEDAIDTLQYYVLQTKTTENDFTLPKVIGQSADFPGIEVTWTSDKPDVIAIQDREGDTYLAKVTQGTETQVVKLTVKHNDSNASKQFNVTVPAFDENSFADNYVFPQENTVVSEDFTLDSTYSLKNKSCAITWSVKSGDDYIAIDGNTCKVTVPAANQAVVVEITATFTYNQNSTTRNYSFTVQEPQEHLQQIHQWYTEKGNVEGSGYLVALGQTYYQSGTFKNVSVYVVDEDFCSGYYLYSINFSEADLDKLVPGVHLTWSGAAVQSPYYGIIETRGGNLSIAEGESAKLDDHVYAIDNEVIGNWTAAAYHLGSLVSLNNWEVKTVNNKDYSGEERGAMLTLEKGGVTVEVAFNKYMEGFYAGAKNAHDEKCDAIINKALTFEVGQYVTVKGVWYANGGAQDGPSCIENGCWQIVPRSADDITAGTADTATPTKGEQFKSAIEAVENKFKDLPRIVLANTDITGLPTKSGDVTIEYHVCGNTNVFTIDGTTLSIKPTDTEETRYVQVTYTLGTDKTYTFVKRTAHKLDDDGVVAEVKGQLGLDKTTFTANGEIDLPTNGDEWGYTGVTITWALKDGETADWLTIEGGKLKVTLPAEAGDAYIVATIKVGTAQDTVEIRIHANAAPTTKIDFTVEPLSEGEHYIGLYQSTLGKWLFGTTKMDGYYIAMTDDPAQAQKWTVAKVAGSDMLFTLKVGSLGYLEKNEDGGDSYIKFVETPTAGKGWSWDSENNAIVWTKDAENAYYLGNYSDQTTLSTSKTTRLGQSGQNVAAFGTIKETAIEGGGSDVGGGDEPTTGDFVALEEPAAGTEYNLAMKIADGKWHYVTGEWVNTYYLGTSTDYSDAAKVELVADGEGWLIKIGGKFLEIINDGSHINVKLNDTQTGSQHWTWDEENKIFVFGTEKYILGTQKSKTFDTVSATKYSNVASNYLVRLGAWDDEAQGGGSDVDPDPDPTPEVNHGTEEDPLTVAEVKAITDLPSGTSTSTYQVWATGYVVKSVKNERDNFYTYYISDTKGNNADSIEVYYCAGEAVFCGDLIVVHGYIKLYNSEPEFVQLNRGEDTNTFTIKTKNTDTIDVEKVENAGANLEIDKTSGGVRDELLITASVKSGFENLKVFVDGVEVTATNSDGKFVAKIGDLNGDGKTTVTVTVDASIPANATHVTLVIGTIAAAQEPVWANDTKYTSLPTGDENFTVTVSGGNNTGKYYTSSTTWRVYQNETPSLTFTMLNGKKLFAVKVNYSVGNTGVMTIGGKNVASDEMYVATTEQQTTCTFSVGNTGTAKNGNIQIKQIEVWYVAE